MAKTQMYCSLGIEKDPKIRLNDSYKERKVCFKVINEVAFNHLRWN